MFGKQILKDSSPVFLEGLKNPHLTMQNVRDDSEGQTPLHMLEILTYLFSTLRNPQHCGKLAILAYYMNQSTATNKTNSLSQPALCCTGKRLHPSIGLEIDTCYEKL